MSESDTLSAPLPWYSRLLVNYQHLTLACLIGICFGLAVSLIALDSSRDAAAQALAAEHASDIARLGADQSSQPLFNNDLLSLQVLLTSLVQLDQIQGLTVHDVENRLLAQAGSVSAENGIYRSAIITQNENVAGYLTVISHRPAKTTGRNIWFAIFALAMGVVLLLLLKRQLPLLEAPDEPQDDTAESLDDVELSIEQTLGGNETAPNTEAVALTLESERLNDIAKQLNADAFGRVLEELNRHINSVHSLYGARLITAGHTLPVLVFDSRDQEQNTIDALCSAQLLLALSYRMKTPLALHAQVEPYHRQGKLAEQPERFKASTKPLFLGIAAPLAQVVEDRFRFREDNGYWLETEEFSENYQSLLDNQLKQLVRTSGYDLDAAQPTAPSVSDSDDLDTIDHQEANLVIEPDVDWVDQVPDTEPDLDATMIEPQGRVYESSESGWQTDASQPPLDPELAESDAIEPAIYESTPDYGHPSESSDETAPVFDAAPIDSIDAAESIDPPDTHIEEPQGFILSKSSDTAFEFEPAAELNDHTAPEPQIQDPTQPTPQTAPDEGPTSADQDAWPNHSSLFDPTLADEPQAPDSPAVKPSQDGSESYQGQTDSNDKHER